MTTLEPVGMAAARTPRRVLRLPEVVSKTGMKPDMIYRGAREGWFPKPFKLSERASGWFEHELEAWLDERSTHRTVEP